METAKEVEKIVQENQDNLHINIDKYSDINKLHRVTAYVNRAIKAFMNKKELSKENQLKQDWQNIKSGIKAVTVPELKIAERYWQKNMQTKYYPEVQTALKGNTSANKKTKQTIHDMQLKLDQHGIIRCFHRMKEIDGEQPILAPNKSAYIRLAVIKAHISQMHAGTRQTLASIRHKYWITKGRRLINDIRRRCGRCHREEGKNYHMPHMADLPKNRTEKTTPFKYTGVDYIGPFYYKAGREHLKCYVALFTCLVTRGVHLEVVTDGNTAAFINALRCFIARRGKPQSIISDNAGIFTNTKETLNQVWNKAINTDEIITYCGKDDIEWKMITAYAPWQGGIYERMVGTFKKAFKKAVGQKILTLEELRTTVTEAEAVVNSRPISWIYSDTKSLKVLRPCDLMINSGQIGSPELEFDESDKEWLPKFNKVVGLSHYWESGQKIQNQFWQLWYDEYLMGLRERAQREHKQAHYSDPREPHIGDVVLIQEMNMPRGSWKMGRITKLIKGRDGEIRNATLKQANGIIINRAINQLCPLETSTWEQEKLNTEQKEEIKQKSKTITVKIDKISDKYKEKIIKAEAKIKGDKLTIPIEEIKMDKSKIKIKENIPKQNQKIKSDDRHMTLRSGRKITSSNSLMISVATIIMIITTTTSKPITGEMDESHQKLVEDIKKSEESKQMVFQFCGSGRSGHAITIPEQVKCQMPPKQPIKETHLDMWIQREDPQRTAAHRCYENVHTIYTRTGFFGARGMLGDTSIHKTVATDECWKAVNTKQWKGQNLTKMSENIWSTNNTLQVEYSWCCYDKANSVDNFFLEIGQVASLDGRTIVTDLHDLSSCRPIIGHCHDHAHGTTVWNGSIFKDQCAYYKSGSYDGTISGKTIIIDQIQGAFSYKDKKTKPHGSDCVPKEAFYVDQGAIFLHFSDTRFTPTDWTSTTINLNEESSLNFRHTELDNYKYQYIIQRLMDMEKTQFSVIWQQLCAIRQTQLDHTRQLFRIDATLGIRALLGRNDLHAEWAGEAIMFWECKSVTAHHIFQTGKVNNTCYKYTPVQLQPGGKLWFRSPGSRELVDKSPIEDCSHTTPHLYQTHNGEWRSAYGPVHVTHTPFTLTWNGMWKAFTFDAPSIYTNVLNKLPSFMETRGQLQRMQNMEETLTKLVDYTSDMSLDPRVIRNALVGAGIGLGHTVEGAGKAYGHWITGVSKSFTNVLGVILHGPLQWILNIAILGGIAALMLYGAYYWITWRKIRNQPIIPNCFKTICKKMKVKAPKPKQLKFAPNSKKTAVTTTRKRIASIKSVSDTNINMEPEHETKAVIHPPTTLKRAHTTKEIRSTPKMQPSKRLIENSDESDCCEIDDDDYTVHYVRQHTLPRN